MPHNHTEYMRRWRANNRDKYRKYIRNYMRKRRELGLSKSSPEYERKMSKVKRYGSVEQWQDAMLKYDGECTFACDGKAELVHHLDGKSIRNSPREDVDNSLKNLLPLCRSCHATLHEKGVKHGN